MRGIIRRSKNAVGKVWAYLRGSLYVGERPIGGGVPYLVLYQNEEDSTPLRNIRC